jgi:hypothetical protein
MPSECRARHDAQNDMFRNLLGFEALACGLFPERALQGQTRVHQRRQFQVPPAFGTAIKLTLHIEIPP